MLSQPAPLFPGTSNCKVRKPDERWECSDIDSRQLPREHPHSLPLYGSSSWNTEGGKALQAWISRNKLSSSGFASRSFLFALHTEISMLVLWGNTLSVSFIELPLLFCLLFHLFIILRTYIRASQIGHVEKESSVRHMPQFSEGATTNLEIQSLTQLLSMLNLKYLCKFKVRAYMLVCVSKNNYLKSIRTWEQLSKIKEKGKEGQIIRRKNVCKKKNKEFSNSKRTDRLSTGGLITWKSSLRAKFLIFLNSFFPPRI